MVGQIRPTKRERRGQRRDEEKQRREEVARRARMVRYLSIGAVAVLVVLAVVLAAGPMSSLFTQTVSAQGTRFANLGQAHVNPGEAHAAYNSNPPTSGPHYPNWAAWGVLEQPQPDELLVHNLEHGGIVIHYNCPTDCPELVQPLKDLVASYRSKVILAPRPNPEVVPRITLTAWTWMDAFDVFDATRIRAFIDAHKDKGPELVPD